MEQTGLLAKVRQSELGTGGPGEGQGGVNRTTGSGESQGEAVKTGNWWGWRKQSWSKQNWELVGLEKAKVE